MQHRDVEWPAKLNPVPTLELLLHVITTLSNALISPMTISL